MSFTAVGSSFPASLSGKTFSLTPHAAGDFILLEVASESAADFATALSSSNVTWTVLVAHTSLGGTFSITSTVFLGHVTSTGTATVTITFNAGSPTYTCCGQEFSNTLGFSALTLDASGTIALASNGKFPSVTPGHGSGDLYWGYVFDTNTGVAGSTSGYTYELDPGTNILAYNTSCANSAQQPNIGDANGTYGIAVMLYEAVTSFSGGAALSGSGALTAGGQVVVPGAAVLSGTGTLTGAPVVVIPSSAVLLGTGALTAAGSVMTPGQVAANLAGSGTLTAGVSVGLAQAAALSGTGTLTAQYTGLMLQAATLAGSGTIAVAVAEALKFTAGLFGAGFLSIPQVAGGLVNGVGGASTPQALPGSSQVAVAPPGSSNWQWLGTLGQVTALTYSYVCPGGCDQMTCSIMVPAAYRTQLFYPGWQVRITRGGHQVWDGKIDQAQFSAGQGWSLSAVGTGNRGTDFTDFYAPGDVWPAGEPDEIINRAIGRGLPWVNPGLNSSPYFSQFWMGQATDPGSSTVTAFLNLICSRGGLTWYVNSQPGGAYAGDDLQVFPLPTVPNRLLVCTTPVPRSLGGYVNSLVIRYCSVADNATTGAAASFDVVSAINQQSVAAHGTLEQYLDLSDVGQMSGSAAQAVGNSILQSYVAASYAGPFAVSHGQLLNMGGQAVDIGADQAGSMVKLVLTDDAYGGSPAPNIPVTFIVGSYSYNDFTQTATIAPYQSLNESLSGLLSMTNTTMTAITAAS